MNQSPFRQNIQIDMSQSYTSPAMRIEGRSCVSLVYKVSDDVSVGGNIVLFGSNELGDAYDSGDSITRWVQIQTQDVSGAGISPKTFGESFQWIQFVYTPGDMATGTLNIDICAADGAGNGATQALLDATPLLNHWNSGSGNASIYSNPIDVSAYGSGTLTSTMEPDVTDFTGFTYTIQKRDQESDDWVDLNFNTTLNAQKSTSFSFSFLPFKDLRIIANAPGYSARNTDFTIKFLAKTGGL